MSLLIVESPAKAKKIQSFFREDVIVKSSFGHINGLDTTKLEKMISDGFEPIYKNTNNKAIQSLKSVKCNGFGFGFGLSIAHRLGWISNL